MSCEVRIVVVGAGSMSADDAFDRIATLEQRWSRFRADSELSILNRCSGRTVGVTDDTRRLVTSLVEAWHVTGGAFDPTLLAPLVGLGYAASRDDATLRTSLAAGVEHRGRPDRILVDPSNSTVTLPRGTVLDAGGLGKGLAADIVVEELLSAGAAGGLVSIGGDLRVAGAAPDGDAWIVTAETAPGDRLTTLRSRDGGVATSSTRIRSWTDQSDTRHHLLDPASQSPTDGDVVGATVVAGSARWAEAFTKPAFVDDLGDWAALVDRHRAAGCAVTSTGERVVTTQWERYAVPHHAGVDA